MYGSAKSDLVDALCQNYSEYPLHLLKTSQARFCEFSELFWDSVPRFLKNELNSVKTVSYGIGNSVIKYTQKEAKIVRGHEDDPSKSPTSLSSYSSGKGLTAIPHFGPTK